MINMKLLNKNIIKIISILLLLILFATAVYAGSVREFNGTISGDATAAKTTLTKIIATSLNVVRTVGAAVAIAMLMIVACKYIMASAGDKADLKKYAFNYVIGAIVLFAASGIITIIKNAVVNTGGGDGS